MKLLYAIFLLNILKLALSEGTPRIVGISDDQIKSVGSSVELKCSIQYFQRNKHVVWWSKISSDDENETFISKNALLVSPVYADRYTIKFNSDLGEYVLQIADIEEDDAGIYQCIIEIDDHRKIRAQTELKVCKTPITGNDVDFLWSPTISNMPAKVVAYIGDSVELNCSVVHNKNLFPVIWLKNNTHKGDDASTAISANSHLLVLSDKLSLKYDPDYPNNYTLQIKNLEKADAGFYRCVVPFSTNGSAVAQIELQIYPKEPPVELPKIIDISKDTRINYYGNEKEFYCKVENEKGYPVLWVKLNDYKEPTIISYKTSVVDSNNKYTVTFDSNSSTYKLKISSVQRSDIGTYQCQIDTTTNGPITANVKLLLPIYPDYNYGR